MSDAILLDSPFRSVGFTPAAALPATKLGITTEPSSSATSGLSFTPQPVIQLLNVNGVPVAQAGVIVTASKLSGTPSLSGTLTATTNASGVATFTNLVLTTAGTAVLRFSTSVGITLVDSTSIVVTSTSDEPLFILGTSVALLIGNYTNPAYTSAANAGAIPDQGGGVARLVPGSSKIQDGNALSAGLSFTTGKDGLGKAARISYAFQPDDGSQQGQKWGGYNTGTHPYLKDWLLRGQIKLSGTPSYITAVKFFHFNSNDIGGGAAPQYCTHDASPATDYASKGTYFQCYDGGYTDSAGHDQGTQPFAPFFVDLFDGNYHRYTYKYRPQSAAGAHDGEMALWIDGKKILWVHSTAVGVTPPGGSKPWCSAQMVANMNVAITPASDNNFFFGGAESSGNTNAFTMDLNIGDGDATNLDTLVRWYNP